MTTSRQARLQRSPISVWGNGITEGKKPAEQRQCPGGSDAATRRIIIGAAVGVMHAAVTIDRARPPAAAYDHSDPARVMSTATRDSGPNTGTFLVACDGPRMYSWPRS
jgi:hypothetical protein